MRHVHLLETCIVNNTQVELPLGATEDRICGTIDIERALTEGIRAYEPGLLVRCTKPPRCDASWHTVQARANRGILYVDEVNLLDDSLVDVVLDSSASGVNTVRCDVDLCTNAVCCYACIYNRVHTCTATQVEREGISIVHPAKFIMIGSGNPQEGELRPQLLDRFGLSVNVGTILDVEVRTQMVLDRIAYDKDPDAFCEGAEAEQQALRDRLDAARARLATVCTSVVDARVHYVCR